MFMNSNNNAKKRKSATGLINSASEKKQATDRDALRKEIGYVPLSLQDIYAQIKELCRRVPPIPDDNFATQTDSVEQNNSNNASAESTVPLPKMPCPYNKTAVKSWATSLQTVLEEFHLLIAVVSPATYRWGTDRSGAADQNLTLLSSELVRSQEQILGRVTPRLNDVLAPVVSLVTDKTVLTKGPDGVEVKQNYFVTTMEDPDYVNLCYTILARNAVSIRMLVLANFDKLLSVVTDYLTAQHKDNQHDSRGFVY